MADFEVEGFDPGRVFEEEYWGTVHPEASRLKNGHTRSKDRRAARSLVAKLTPKIVSGELTGQEFKAGRFNPTDPDLARASAFSMPGTLLISDTERLRPLDSFSRDELKQPWREGKGDPRDQSATTRHLLRASRQYSNGTVHYGKGRLIYSNDTYEYERTVSVNMLVPTTGGTSSPRDLVTLGVGGNEEATTGLGTRPIVLLAFSTTLSRDVQLGETYDQTVQDSPGNYRYLGFNRLVSLEVCMQGEPAEVRAGIFSQAASRLAHGFGQ